MPKNRALGYKQQDIVSVKSNTKDRAFVRGIIPKTKSNAGRPRKK